jgi:hypothetical protein
LKEEVDDLKHIVSLDPSRELFKPKSLYKRYELSGSKYHAGAALNHIYDREVQKVRENRYQIKEFLSNQQKWLS